MTSVELDNLFLCFDGIGLSKHEGQVSLKNLVFVFLAEGQLEETFRRSHVALAKLLGARQETPPELDIVEGVCDFLVFVIGEAHGLLPGRFANAEAHSGGTDLCPEIDLGDIVDLVARHAKVLHWSTSRVNSTENKGAKMYFMALVDVGAQRDRHELVGYGAHEHHECCEGGMG